MGVSMTSATITSKGQVTIPVDVRNKLSLSAGDRIEFILNDATGRYEVKRVASIEILLWVLSKAYGAKAPLSEV